MNIEISLVDNGKPLASAYAKLYAAQSDPIVDIVVREAIQNSLDAGLGTNIMAESKDYVAVEFSIRNFESKRLSEHLSGISKKLDDLYPQKEYPFLAIRDTYTSGLTGPLNYYTCESPEDPGNLIKLVFNIAQPNTEEGAGGSCGIGKTIFYTLGAGIVIYYSRIYEEKLKNFQSRLVVCMIDTKLRGIIPNFNRLKNTGIAWWGDKYESYDNKIIPITDERRINEFLSIFGIAPYKEKETGTTLIIPYVDEKEIKSRNVANDEKLKQVLNQTLRQNIEDAVQRWYMPRLLNSSYSDFFKSPDVPVGSRKFLKFYFDDGIGGSKQLKQKELKPIIRIYQALYNYALTGKISEEVKEYIEEEKIELKRDTIRINELLSSPTAGWIAYCYVSKLALRLVAPDNNPSPREFLHLPNLDGRNANCEPIIGFCRRSGMVASYNGEGWLKSVPNLPDNMDNQYMFCFFVLNPLNRLSDKCKNDSGLLLDEYVRKSELNDHKDWKNDVYNIVDKIKKNTANKLNKEINGLMYKEPDEAGRDGRLIKEFTEKLMPSIGFGNKAKDTNKSRRQSSINRSTNSLIILDDDTKYTQDAVNVTYIFSKRTTIKSITFDLHISAEKGSLTVYDWSSMGLPVPFNIVSTEISINPDRSAIDSNDILKYKENAIEIEGNKCVHGVKLTFNEKGETFKGELMIKLKIKIYDKSVKTELMIDR